jgi:hypothetical protein
MKTERIWLTALLGLLLGGWASAQTIRDTVILRVRRTNESLRLVYYRLSDGYRLDTASFNRWHLAFEVPGFTAAIRANLGAGMVVWRTSRAATSAEWTALSLNDTLQRLYDSETQWTIGAFNTTANPLDNFDLGWGNYNLTTHVIAGDSLYILRLPNGTFRKLWIDRLQSGIYYFKYANLDGTGEVDAQAPKSLAPRRGFVYYNFLSQEALNLEPVDSLWDLVFTQYLSFFPSAGLHYAVLGALQNRRVAVARIPLSPSANPDTLSWQSAPYDTLINAIGHDWKQYDMQNNLWLVADSVYYLVRTRNREVWRMRFVAFGDSTAPDNAQVRYAVIERKKLGSVSLLGSSFLNVQVFAYPNPATEGIWVTTRESGPIQVEVYDLAGQRVLSQVGEGSAFLYVPRQGLPSGLYFLRVHTAKGTGLARILFE